MHRHSHIALHPYSLLYHRATLPPESLQAAASSGQLFEPSFWKQHLPAHIADTYYRYLALEKPSTPATSNKTKTWTNTPKSSPTPSRTHPCAYQSDPRRRRSPRGYRHSRVCPPEAGAHPLPDRAPLPVTGRQLLPPQPGPCHAWRREQPRKYVSSEQRDERADATSALTPQQVREHFATTILAPIMEHPDLKKHLQQAWRTHEGQLRTLTLMTPALLWLLNRLTKPLRRSPVWQTS